MELIEDCNRDSSEDIIAIAQLGPDIDRTFILEGQTDDGWSFRVNRAFIILHTINSQSPDSWLFRIDTPEHLGS